MRGFDSDERSLKKNEAQVELCIECNALSRTRSIHKYMQMIASIKKLLVSKSNNKSSILSYSMCCHVGWNNVFHHK